MGEGRQWLQTLLSLGFIMSFGIAVVSVYATRVFCLSVEL